MKHHKSQKYSIFLFASTSIIFILLSFFMENNKQWDPYLTRDNTILQKPSLEFPLGTDELGRNILSRVIVGTANSLTISFLAVAISLFSGLFISLIAVSFHKYFLSSFLFLSDVTLSIPILILCLVIAATSEVKGKTIIIIGEIVAFTPLIMRVSIQELINVMKQEFTRVSIGYGKHPFFVAIQHGLPFLLPKLYAQSITLISIAIGIEGGLSYFGLGIQLPKPSLGILLQQSRNYLYVSPWYTLAPSIVFFALLCMLSFVVLHSSAQNKR